MEEFDIESTDEYEIGRIRGGQDCGANVGCGELGMNPRSGMDNIAEYPG